MENTIKQKNITNTVRIYPGLQVTFFNSDQIADINELAKKYAIDGVSYDIIFGSNAIILVRDVRL